MTPSLTAALRELAERLRASAAGAARTSQAKDSLQAASDRADARTNGLFRPLMLLVHQWSRHHRMPLSPDRLESMAYSAFGEPPPGWPEGLKTLFLHLASAVLDPPAAAEGAGEAVMVRPDRWSLALWAAAEQVQQAMDQEAAGYEAEAHRSLGDLFGAEYPALTPEPLQVLLVLDVHQGALTRALQSALPSLAKSLQVIELHRDCGGPRLPGDVQLTPDHWNQIAAAVSRMASQAQAVRPKSGPPVDFFLYGRAPLPALVQLGMELGAGTGRQFFLEQRADGTWGLLPLQGAIDTDRPAFFGVVRGLKKAEPSLGKGRAAVFVGKGHAVPLFPITDFFEDHREEMAGLIEVRPESPELELTERDSASAASELLHAFRQLRTAYPGASGVVLFVSTRSPIAFMAGRALKPGLIGSVLTTYHRDDAYHMALSLPWKGSLAHVAPHRLTVHRLSLSGYRGLDTQEFSFGPQLTVFIGANGTGKSSVLDALAVMLSQLLDTLWEHSGRQHFQREDIANGQDALIGKVMVSIDGEEFDWTLARKRQDRDRKPLPTDKGLRKRLEPLGKELLEHPEQSLPLAVYFSVDRAHLDIPERLRKKTSDERFSVYDHALVSGEVDFRTFFDWFKDQEDIENAERRTNAAYENRKLSAVRRAMERLLGEGFANPRIRRAPLRLVLDKKGQELSLNQLSDGERGLIALAGDLARRLTDANPALVDPLQGSAVVLIDELELHLHPAWQRDVVPHLRRTFPNCQFIVTTHSPQVLSHVRAEDIRILRWEDRKIVQAQPDAAYGLDSNRILEDLMGVPRQPQEIRARFDALYAAIHSGDLQEARSLQADLTQDIGPDYPEFVKIDMLLRRRERQQ
jgi:predicted ATP-binding protein involved in virulence